MLLKYTMAISYKKCFLVLVENLKSILNVKEKKNPLLQFSNTKIFHPFFVHWTVCSVNHESWFVSIAINISENAGYLI